MAEVVIERCTVRVVRNGGWSWSADRRALVRGVVDGLRRLLTETIAAGVPADAAGEVTAPVRVRLRLPAEALAELAPTIGRGGAADAPGRLRRVLAEAFHPCLEQFRAQVLPRVLGSEDAPGPVESARVEPSERAGESAEARASRAPERADGGSDLAWSEHPPELTVDALLRLLLRLRAHGRLAATLAGAPRQVARRYLDRLTSLPTAVPERLDRDRLRSLLEREARALTPALVARAPEACRLVLLTEALHAFGTAPPETTLRETLRDAVPSVERQVAVAVPARAEARTAATFHDRVPQLRGEVHVPSVLPWLLLGPLARLGYLENLAATLELAGLTPLAPCFATALAYKVLDPPERGWRRSAAAVATGEAFAGLSTQPGVRQLDRFAHAFERWGPLLDAELLHATQADVGASGLLLTQIPALVRGALLLAVEDLRPIAWLPRDTDLAAADRDAVGGGLPPVIVPADAAEQDTLAALDAAGYRFVTPAPPTRGDAWIPVRGFGPPRWWTNRGGPLSAALRRAMRELPAMHARLATCVDELVAHRIAVPRTPTPVVERSVTLAAATALASIAHRLWYGREPVDPQLTLARLGDLDARVRFDRDAVRVRVPLGKRHHDLFSHGLLDTVHDIPWLHGRRVELSGG